MLQCFVSGVGHMYENADHTQDEQAATDTQAQQQQQQVSPFQMDKLQSALRQIVRDWSLEGLLFVYCYVINCQSHVVVALCLGANERAQCYQPIIDAVLKHHPKPSLEIKILVPGAGLGRLAWEFARLGYSCQGNEFSLHMLFMSNFILNRCANKVAFIHIC